VGELGFGVDEAAFDGGFENGGLVALEVGDGFVEARELFLDFRDDVFLLVEGCDRDLEAIQGRHFYVVHGCALF